jgi:exo-1,4-beta-D-glucosaminidase
VIVNSRYEPQPGLKLRTRIFDLSTRERFSDLKNVDAPPDSVTRVLTLPDLPDIDSAYFIRLDLSDAAGEVGTNFYWVPKHLAELDWEKSNYFTTPAKYAEETPYSVTPAKYADMTGLSRLPPTDIEWNSQTEHRTDESVIRVTLKNSGKALAFMVHAAIKRPNGEEVSPVFWDDNYVSLLPGESRIVTAAIRARDLVRIQLVVNVEGWNIKARHTGDLQ